MDRLFDRGEVREVDSRTGYEEILMIFPTLNEMTLMDHCHIYEWQFCRFATNDPLERADVNTVSRYSYALHTLCFP